MKNSNKKLHYLKHIDEKFNDPYLNSLRNMADEDQVDDVNDNTNNQKEFTVVIFDIEELQEKLYLLKLDNETDNNNIRYFENQILVRNEEITRLEEKLKRLGQ